MYMIILDVSIDTYDIICFKYCWNSNIIEFQLVLYVLCKCHSQSAIYVHDI